MRDREWLRESSLVFLGDSLTDGGWETDPQRHGQAWPAAVWQFLSDSGLDVSIINRARGGWRSVEVWKDFRDAGPFDLQDAVVTILVGANDVWRRWVPWLDHDPVDPDDFCRTLTRLVQTARERGARQCVLATPCLLHTNPDHEWNGVMREYRQLVAEVARREGALLVHTGEEFEGAVRAHPVVKWTYDGVHPRPVGHERLARTWLQAVLDWEPLAIGAIPERPLRQKLGSWP